MVADPAIDSRIVGERYMKDPIGRSHIHPVEGWRSRRVEVGIGIGLLLDVPHAHLDRLQRLVQPGAERGKVGETLGRQLAEPLCV